MHRRATTLLIVFGLLLVSSAGAAALATPQSRGHLWSTADATQGRAGKKRPALAEPARPDALSRALDADRISPARYALERARSLFALDDVRARFGRVTAPDPHAATMLMRDLALRLDELPPTQRTVADRILARPTDGFPADLDGYSVPEAPKLCSDHVCVHYVASTPDAPPPADLDTSGVRDYVEATSDVMEEVWTREVVNMHYRAPKSDQFSDNNGGNAKLDVYLADIGDDGIFGYCASDDPNLIEEAYHFWDMSGYCVLDNDYLEFGFPDPLDALRVTAAHEFFHAVQFAYDIGEDPWFMEGTATWIEDVVYDDINDNLRYLASGPIGQPIIPLDRNTGFRIYGTWIFWRFLTEYFGETTPAYAIVRQVWNKADGSAVGPDLYSTQAAAQTVAQRTVNGTPWKLRWAFADFAVWNLRAAKFYEEGATYPAPFVARTLTLTKTAPSFRSNITLDHLSNRAVGLRRGAGLPKTARLRIVVNGPGYGTGPEATALVIRTNGTAFVRVVNLNGNGDGAVVIGFGPTIARAIVVMTNASARYTACYSDQTPYACFGGVPLDEDRPYSFRATVI